MKNDDDFPTWLFHATYEQTQETMALLKILALGNRQIENGKAEPGSDAIKRLRQKRRNR